MKRNNLILAKKRVNPLRLKTSSAYQSYNSPIGLLHILASHAHVTAVLWDHEMVHYEEFKANSANSISQLTKNELSKYFSGKQKCFDLPIYQSGTEFQKECETYLTKIPYGQTRSYLQQATDVRSPKHARAVAGSNAANPISIIVPCHRIIGENGALGGYAGTVAVKKKLLELEKKYT